MQARFLLGPAGSGKTRRCLDEIRAELRRSQDGPPLLLLAPKQATFQLERQLLADPSVPGFTRLQILSFDRLAHFIIEEVTRLNPAPGQRTAEFGVVPRKLLSEQGRVMVLRAILAREQPELQVFRAVAQLPGFAQELSLVLRELQQYQLLPERLLKVAERVTPLTARKLRDFAGVLGAYHDWLQENGLTDGDRLLDLAAEGLRAQTVNPAAVTGSQLLLFDTTDFKPSAPGHFRFQLAGLWLDGFAEMTPQELDLLAALIPLCKSATLAFCLEREPDEAPPWLSTWSIVARTFRSCHQRLAGLPGCQVSVENLDRTRGRSRFSGNPVLEHLEKHWTDPRRWEEKNAADGSAGPSKIGRAIRVAVCANPEAEATLAAHEILQHTQAGGRYRDCAVVLRTLDGYRDCIRRVFNRYEIPFFLDRREPVAHHPLAELTRYALRTAAFGWRQDDWFGALKTGLVPGDETMIDRLENEALARGWEGNAWAVPLRIPGDRILENRLESLRQELTPPFHGLATRLKEVENRPTGAQLAGALRELWRELDVERRLEDWCRGPSMEAPQDDRPSAIHSTVWDHMLDWLENLERAFHGQALTVREWLPILDTGLSSLTVGVVPPSLDQVLIGAVDRSRNPDLQVALVLGINESVFPAPGRPQLLLTDEDRALIEQTGVFVGHDAKSRRGHERYLGYMAFTRAGQRLVLSWSKFDTQGRKLNPSPFLADLEKLFPDLKAEDFAPGRDWRESVHPSDLVVPLLRLRLADPASPVFVELAELPRMTSALRQIETLSSPAPDETLSPAVAEKLYGSTLQTSVTRLERFAECPFRFFIHSGLRTQERLRFEADRRQIGSFQHEVLKRFHDQLHAEGRSWRDLTPDSARERIGVIAEQLKRTFGEGVLVTTEQARFVTRNMIAALQDFTEIIVGWMNRQYQFGPAAAELRFGPDGELPAWGLNLSEGHHLALTGIIDRVDLLPAPDRSSASCVVVDYKSSAKKIDPRLLENGIQLQLPAYLNVLRRVPEAAKLFGVGRLVPVGIFYVSLAGQYPRGANRNEVLDDLREARRLAYQHTGRFNREWLPHLDSRPQEAGEEKIGDQFNFGITVKGKLSGRHRDPLSADDFLQMLDSVEELLRRIGEHIFQGEAGVDPYRLGAKTPCENCDYQPVCRIDPWTHKYRTLRRPGTDRISPAPQVSTTGPAESGETPPFGLNRSDNEAAGSEAGNQYPIPEASVIGSASSNSTDDEPT